jgi:hypothetical protein
MMRCDTTDFELVPQFITGTLSFRANRSAVEESLISKARDVSISLDMTTVKSWMAKAPRR